MVTSHQIEGRLEDKEIPLLTLDERADQGSMLVVPFEPSKLSPQLLKSALDMAETESAELVLLCVRPPAEAMRYGQEDERLYSKLRGLQAQVQKRSIPVNIETVTGPVAQFVLDFAEKREARMILITGQQKASGGGIPQLRARSRVEFLRSFIGHLLRA